MIIGCLFANTKLAVYMPPFVKKLALISLLRLLGLFHGRLPKAQKPLSHINGPNGMTGAATKSNRRLSL